MDQTSSIVTGGVTLSAASLVPAVQWFASGCPMPMPAEVQLLIAGALVTGAHAVRNLVLARAARKQSPQQASPQ